VVDEERVGAGTRIVVGVDGSEPARGALAWALDEARLRKATLEVVHAWHFPFEAATLGTAAAVPIDDPAGWARQILDQRLAEMAPKAKGVPVVVRVEFGSAARVLLDVSQGADALVVGSRGRRRLTGLLIGSVGQFLVARAPCPVIVVHVNEAHASTPAEDTEAPAPAPGTLDEISEEECLALLAGQQVGRLAVVANGQPLVFPVNYILDGRTVAFRTDPGTKLDWAAPGRVAFEVDGIDLVRHEGWSVLVQGAGKDITDDVAEWSKRLRTAPLAPWASGEKGRWLAISSPQLSGRRLRQPDKDDTA
jgi:nucleotide-binding universal stress UspA family protein